MLFVVTDLNDIKSEYPVLLSASTAFIGGQGILDGFPYPCHDIPLSLASIISWQEQWAGMYFSKKFRLDRMAFHFCPMLSEGLQRIQWTQDVDMDMTGQNFCKN